MTIINPYIPSRDLMPEGMHVVPPLDVEDQCWRDTVIFVYSKTRWLPPEGTRVIWFKYDAAEKYRPFVGQVIFEHPPVVLLEAGRRLADLRKTIVHEIRHLWQAAYHVNTWAPSEREDDAEAFVARMMRR